MAAVSSSSSPPSVTMERFTYDVFLSFRGEDTRFGFTGNLWKALRDRGIRTFMDDEELRKGEEITPSLLNAIEGSRMAIVVLSLNYASSSFCLQELSKILDCCQKENGRSVWPVFYDVDPSDVRKLTGTYGEAMAIHEARSNDNMDRLQKCKEALHQVANLSGFHFKNGQEDEDEFIGRIVQEVSVKINRASLYVADYPVGLDSRLEEVCSELELGSSDERNLMLGIYGMPGIGKSTLARAVYNRIEPQFESSCFLHSVREYSNIHGLVYLQNIMLSKIVGENDIQIKNVNQGVSIIKHRLHRKKVLLVLDDVDKLEQLEALVGGHDWFGFGSRVIITTRDRHLLVFHGVERIYEVQALNHKDALQLLSHKAFKNGNVDPNCTEILNRVVTYASGLPLALEVIGSYLFGRSVDEWENAFDRIERIPHNDIQRILKTSFDAFQIEEQSVFLDIACCFKGYELTKVQDILCAHYGQNVKSHIQLLIDKSLISISLDCKVTLHPLIEAMGKEIVRQESPIEPGKRSRLWHPKDVVRVLEENKGTNKIEIIHLDSPLIEDEEVKWDGEAFKKMENLRTLIVRKCNFSKAPKHLPNSLRVLEWQRFHSLELPSDFDTKQLDICKLSNMEFMSSKLAELLKISCEVPKASQRSESVPKDSKSSQSDAKDSESSPSVAEQDLQSSQTTGGGPNESFAQESSQDGSGDQSSWWKLLAFVSNVIGLICYSLSPSFNCLIGGRNFVKIIVYCVIYPVTFLIIFFAEKYPDRFVLHKIFIRYAVQIVVIPVYSLYYEKAVNGKPEILSLLSNAAFAMVSLCLSKLYGFGFEIGTFSYFLSCLAVQLFTIKPLLILVAIFINSVLLTLYSYPLEDVIQGLLTHLKKLGPLLEKMGHLHNPGPNR